MLLIDVAKFILQWLPPLMRSNEEIVLLKVLTKGLQYLCKDMTKYFEQKDLEVNASSQRMVLEHLLKKTLSNSQIQVITLYNTIGFEVFLPSYMTKREREIVNNIVKKYKLVGIPFKIKHF